MTEPGTAPAAAPGFSVTGALGMAREVFRTRPVSVVRLVLLQALIFATLSTAQLWLMGYLGRGFEDASRDPVALMQANALISLFSLGASLSMVAVWAWIEALWLELYVRDRRPAQLDAGAFFRVLAAFVILYLIIMVATFVLAFAGAIIAVPFMIALSMGGEPGMATVISVTLAAIFAPLIVFMLLVMSRLSALPALAFLRGGMPLGLAWRGAKGRVGRLIAAWSVWGVLYLVAMIIMVAILALGPGPFADVFREVIENPQDPMAQYRAYAAFSRSPGEVAGYWGVTVAANILFAALLMAARGIGVSLALDTMVREAAADEG